VAAQRFGIQVIFTYAAANHHHTGTFDPDKRYPEFLAFGDLMLKLVGQ